MAQNRSMTTTFNPSSSGETRARQNVWLRWTSYRGTNEPPTIERREHIRRSQLMSWILLGLLVSAIVLLPLGFSNLPTLDAVVAAIVAFLLALILNRGGHTMLAGLLVILALDGGILFGNISQPGGLPLDALPAFDLLSVTVIIGATVLPRGTAFAIAMFNSILILGNYLLQPHGPDLIADARYYGGATASTIALLVRPIALEIIVAVVAYLWVRSTDNAIRRADRAEEIASLEHSLAEQKRQLDIGIQQILQTHVRVANGDFNARTPLGQDNILWQIGVSLNNLLARLQRTSQAEYLMQRTQEEISHIIAAIDDMQAGRRPIWPAPTGTPADALLERLVQAAQIAAPPRSGPSQPQARPGGQSPTTANDPHAYGSFPINPPSRAPYSTPDPYPYRAPNSTPTSRDPNSGYPFPAHEPPNQGTHSQSGSNPWAFPIEDDEQHP